MARQSYQSRKSSRTFERLEARAMLAGHVNTLVDGNGNLMISGDRAPNTIAVQQMTPTSWQVIGFGTAINGRHQRVTVQNVTGNISIDLGGGPDSLSVHDGNIDGSLTILMNNGADRTSLQNLAIRDFLHYEGGAGNDTFQANNVTVLDPLDAYFSSIDTQNGNDRVMLDQFNDQDLVTTLGNGNDRMTVTNSSLGGGSSDRLNIDAGAGIDNVQLDSISTGALNVDMGAGNRDVLSVQRSLAKSSSLHGGAGVHDKLFESANLLGAGGSNLIDGFEKIT